MSFWDWLFVVRAGCVAYTYLGYPLVVALVGACKKHLWHRAPFTGSITIVLVARNEENNIGRRLRELTGLLNFSSWSGEILVVSDGSQDDTVPIALKQSAEAPVRVISRPTAEGKAAALTAGCLTCGSDVLVFADARQRWAPDALERLLENFADPNVGAVSGDLILETAPGVLAGVGLYWRFEKWLRRQECLIHSQVGVTGAIAAVRRELFRPIPRGALLDDVYWPLAVAMQGFRVVHDERAQAFDRLPDNPRDEFRRKARTLAGNFQLAGLLPTSLLPWRNPVWIQWVSHKLLRLVAPWALLGLFMSSFFLEGWLQSVLWLQVAGYGLAAVGLWKPVARKTPLAAAAASFVVLNTAAFAAFWVWLSGRAGRSWSKVSYREDTRDRGMKNEERRIKN